MKVIVALGMLKDDTHAVALNGRSFYISNTYISNIPGGLATAMQLIT
jgi:hypothetical protein